MSDKERGNAFGRWYERNGASLNESRRDRYRKDPEYRKQCIQAARESRAARKAGGATGEPVLRNVGGSLIKVYRSGDLAAAAGVSRQLLLKMEGAGVIPKPTIPGVHRLYTERQAQAVIAAINALRDLAPNSEARRAETAIQTLKIRENWS